MVADKWDIKVRQQTKTGLDGPEEGVNPVEENCRIAEKIQYRRLSDVGAIDTGVRHVELDVSVGLNGLCCGGIRIGERIEILFILSQVVDPQHNNISCNPNRSPRR